MKKEMKLLIDRFGLSKEHDLLDLEDFAYDNGIDGFVFDRLYCDEQCDKFESDVYGYEKYHANGFVLHVYPFGCGRDDNAPSLFRITTAQPNGWVSSKTPSVYGCVSILMRPKGRNGFFKI